MRLADRKVQCREQLLLGDLVAYTQSCTGQYDLVSSSKQEVSMLSGTAVPPHELFTVDIDIVSDSRVQSSSRPVLLQSDGHESDAAYSCPSCRGQEELYALGVSGVVLAGKGDASLSLRIATRSICRRLCVQICAACNVDTFVQMSGTERASC